MLDEVSNCYQQNHVRLAAHYSLIISVSID